MTGQCLLATVVIYLTFTTATHAKTVVFFPPPSESYFIYHTNVAASLAGLGHDVWICVPYFLLQKNVVKDKAVKILEYGEQLGDLKAKVFGKTRVVDKFWTNEFSIEIITFYYLTSEYSKIAYDILSDNSFVEKVKSLKPDLFVLDSIPFNLNMIVLPYMLDIPYALIGTFHDVVLSKVPYSPAAPIFPFDTMSDRMSFMERLLSLLFYILRIHVDVFYDSSLVSKFAPHNPYKSINDLAANAEVFIAEVDHILDYPRPTLPNTKLIGGSSASPANPLVGEFKKFVDESKNGIIVVSFGAYLVNIPLHITSKMVSAFNQLDLRVVWKVNITSPDPNRIMTSMWLPQNDLLGHEKTKLFLSHCGKNGQYEALYHGVPILCLPIYGDQGYNAERVLVKQLGLRVDMREASADELAALMKEIVYEDKYAENMKRASSLYRELYKIPKKKAAYWLDHVMKYGGEYMRSAGQKMPWYKLYVLDVIAFIITIIIVILLFVYLLIERCFKVCRGGHRRNKPKKE